MAEREPDHERGRAGDDPACDDRVEQALAQRAPDECDCRVFVVAHDRGCDRCRDRRCDQPQRLGSLVRDRIDADCVDTLQRLEHEELGAVADQRDHLQRSHRERKSNERLRRRVDERRNREWPPEVARQVERERSGEDVRRRPREQRSVNLSVETDDEDERPDHRQQRRGELDVVPGSNPREPEQDSRARLPDHVRHERGGCDRRGARADGGGELADADDRRPAREPERQCNPERPLDERTELVRLVPLRVAHPVRHRDSELAEEAREDRHRQHREHERAAAVRSEKAPLQDDEQECERRREPAEEEDLDDVAAELLRRGHLCGADELRVDRRGRGRRGLVRRRVDGRRRRRSTDRPHGGKLTGAASG